MVRSERPSLLVQPANTINSGNREIAIRYWCLRILPGPILSAFGQYTLCASLDSPAAHCLESIHTGDDGDTYAGQKPMSEPETVQAGTASPAYITPEPPAEPDFVGPSGRGKFA
jgi:hypothetical protein